MTSDEVQRERNRATAIIDVYISVIKRRVDENSTYGETLISVIGMLEDIKKAITED